VSQLGQNSQELLYAKYVQTPPDDARRRWAMRMAPHACQNLQIERRMDRQHYALFRRALGRDEPLVNWLKVRTQMLGRGPFVRTFSQKTMGRRFGYDFHSLAHRRRVGYFSREKGQYRVSFAVKHSPLRERYELHRFLFVRRFSVISDHWVKFVRTFIQITSHAQTGK
jgi:hypothetical protein